MVLSCLQSFPVFHGDIFVHVNLSRNELGRPWVPTEEDIEVVGMTSGSHIGTEGLFKFNGWVTHPLIAYPSFIG